MSRRTHALASLIVLLSWLNFMFTLAVICAAPEVYMRWGAGALLPLALVSHWKACVFFWEVWEAR